MIVGVITDERLLSFDVADAFRESFENDSRGSGIKDDPKLTLVFLAGVPFNDLSLAPFGDLQAGEAVPRELGVASPLQDSR